MQLLWVEAGDECGLMLDGLLMTGLCGLLAACVQFALLSIALGVSFWVSMHLCRYISVCSCLLCFAVAVHACLWLA